MTDRGAQPGTEAQRLRSWAMAEQNIHSGYWVEQLDLRIEAALAEAHRQGREMLDVERLAKAICPFDDDHWQNCRAGTHAKEAKRTAERYAALAADPRPEP